MKVVAKEEGEDSRDTKLVIEETKEENIKGIESSDSPIMNDNKTRPR